MYLSKLKLWNFRKFGSGDELIIDKELRDPDLEINFTKGLNVLIGENDSGKTAIIDAIKLMLKTHSFEWIKLEIEDFYEEKDKLRIECRFDDLSSEEAKNFTEWLGIEGERDEATTYLKVILEAQKKNDRIFPSDIKAGADDEGYLLTAEAKEYLKTTYLKPLRDAKSEFVPKKNSRLSQILQGHEVFKEKKDDHDLVTKVFKDFCDRVEDYFKKDEDGEKIKTELDYFLKQFFGEERKSKFEISEQKLKNILETLRLTLEDGKLGLGSHNLLFIASELLNLKRKDWDGIRLGLIEELEAHLHPQGQMKVVEFLQNEKAVQFILTTHSPNLASKVELENLIICADDSNEKHNIFPMGIDYTKLKEADYKFLEKFLDVTKSNLFFAKGVILVEGWAEEILLPTLARKIGINLTEKGVSIVNVGSTAFLRYAKIFQRNQEPLMNNLVSIITDIDIKPEDEGDDLQTKITEKENKYSSQRVKGFVSPYWTLEYCLGLSPKIAPLLFEAVKKAITEMRKDDNTTYARAEETRQYSDLLGDQKEVAKEIYKNIIIAKKVSKTIIAQYLVQIIENNNTLTKEAFENESSPIKYLIDAIKYATNED